MATKIEWTDETWNCITGCTRVSAGCDHCYSARMTYRLEGMGQEKYTGLTVLNPRGERHFNGVVRCHDDALTIPLRWKKPRRIFVNSMSDTFHKDVPFEFIDRMFAVMALCPQHTFQVLTKRPERMAEYLDEVSKAEDWDRTPSDSPPERDIGRWMSESYSQRRDRGGKPNIYGPFSNCINDPKKWEWCSACHNWPLPNVWLGTSVENQQAADERIPHLLRCPAAVRFLSAEPLLGLLSSLTSQCADAVSQLGKKALDGIHWVIVGGESGPGSRPCNIEWIRSIIQQCREAGVACFVKQLGAKPVCVKADCQECGGNGLDHPDYINGEPCFACHGTGTIDAELEDVLRHRILDPKGGDWDEWPEDLRVREFPKEAVPHE
ncbi:MAG: phage Gp37/Gp68 family protein [Planctomycetes bacterium]|nr:phage Gp37/Gp68 family protein [Planctomycetota bacterium]